MDAKTRRQTRSNAGGLVGTAEKEETESWSDQTQQSAAEGVGVGQVALCHGATASRRHGHVVAEAHRLQPRWQAEASRG